MSSSEEVTGRAKGGKARAERLSSERKHDIAKRAAVARWQKPRGTNSLHNNNLIQNPGSNPRAAAERWAAFGRAVMAQHKDGDCGDVDGGWLQETGVQTGVLQIVEAKGPCAEEGCMCAATCGDWPVDCYRVVTP